jgi:hypothetical protein
VVGVAAQPADGTGSPEGGTEGAPAAPPVPAPPVAERPPVALPPVAAPSPPLPLVPAKLPPVPPGALPPVPAPPVAAPPVPTPPVPTTPPEPLAPPVAVAPPDPIVPPDEPSFIPPLPDVEVVGALLPQASRASAVKLARTVDRPTMRTWFMGDLSSGGKMTMQRDGPIDQEENRAPIGHASEAVTGSGRRLLQGDGGRFRRFVDGALRESAVIPGLLQRSCCSSWCRIS